MATPHTVIAEKYRLLRKLGEGGMGAVWLAEHLTLRSHVAIKLIDVGIVTSTEALARFLREAQSAAALRSPHVVQILDHGVDNGTPYIAMELLEGESLADRLTRVGRLAPPELARIMIHVARAVSRAHEAGIVHRDLKPDNIFLVRNDDEEIAKVLDFGIAKSAAAGSAGASVSAATRTGSVLGTPYYMSPEQAEGAKSLDHRTDIWAMGVIAFECLLGRRPFDAETLASLLLTICARPIPIPSQCGPVPTGFDAWFSRACERDVNRRFSSAKEAAAELKRVCEGGLDATLHASQSFGASSSVPAQSSTGPGPTAPGLSGQSVVGLSSSQLGATAGKRAGSGVAVALALVALAVVAAAGALFAWSRFGASRSPATVASEAPSVLAAPRPPPSAQVEPRVEPSSVTEAPSSAPASTQASASAPASPADPPAPAKRGAAAAPTRDNAAHHHVATGAATEPTSPERAKPAAPAKVNLGI